MKKKYVIGNWKANPSNSEQARALAKSLKELTDKVNVGCVPSFVHVGVVADILANSNVWVGVQDICAFTADTGAFTGDISAEQAVDLGARFVLIGHSERRSYYKESNALLAKKITQALTKNLAIVLCVGETKEQYEKKETLAVLDEQLSVLAGLDISSAHLVVAYEPVWAIGTGLTPTIDEIVEVHSHIKANLTSQHLGDVCVLYGGSVNDKNVTEFVGFVEIDGVLVGGASLKIESFAPIVSAFA